MLCYPKNGLTTEAKSITNHSETNITPKSANEKVKYINCSSVLNDTTEIIQLRLLLNRPT